MKHSTPAHDIQKEPNSALFRQLISKHKDTILDISILCVPAVVLTMIWFHTGDEIAGLEPGLIAHNNEQWLYLTSYTWSDLYGTGVANSRIVVGISTQTILTALERLGLEPSVREAIYFGSVLSTNSIGMYYLTGMFVHGKQRRMAAILAGLFFMLNSYQMFAWNRMAFYFIATPLIPLSLAFFVRGLRSKNIIKPAIVLSIILLINSGGFVIYPLHIPIILSVFLLFYLILQRSKERIFHALKFAVVVVILVALTQVWWLLPVYTGQAFDLEKTSSISDLEFVSFNLNTLPEILRLFYDYHAFSMMDPFYNSGPLLAVGYLIAGLAFGAFIVKRRKEGVIFFGLLALIGIFLSKGLNPPFGDGFLFIWENIPYLAAIRTLFEKTGVIIAVAYAFLAAITLSTIYYNNIEGKIRLKFGRAQIPLKRILSTTFVAITCFCIFGPYMWPMWTGDVLSFPWDRTYRVKVPEYYSEASAWINRDPDDYRIVTLPLTKGDGGKFKWENDYAGTWPQVSLFSKPVIATSTYSVYSKDAAAILDQLHYIAETERIAKVLGMFNSKYVVIIGDLDARFEKQYTGSVRDTPEEVESRLNLLRIPSQSIAQDIRATEVLPGTTSSPSFDQYWSASWGSDTSFSSTNNTSPAGFTPIRIEGVSDNNGNFGAWYSLTDQPSWSFDDILTIWMKSEVPGKIFVSPNDSDGGSGIWHGSYDTELQVLPSEVGKWKRIELNVSQMRDLINVDLNSLQRMIIALQDLSPNAPVSFEIGGITHDRVVSTTGNVKYPNFISNWEKTWGENSSMSISSTVDSITNSTVLSLRANPTTGDQTHLGLIGAKYKIPTTFISKGWQDNSYLNFWLRTSHPGNLWIELDDINGAHRVWDGYSYERYRISEEDVGEWKYLSLPADISGSIDNGFKFNNTASIVIGLSNLDPEQFATLDISSLSVAPPVWERINDFEFMERFGNLSIYKINNDYVVDHINANPSYGITRNTFSIMSDVTSDRLDPKKEAILLRDNLTPEQLSFLNMHVNENRSIPNLTYEKINPTKYIIHIANSTSPFFLGFVESFDSNWEAKVNGRVLDDKYHIQSYQNVWYITEHGDYDIVLEYTPQRTFYLGSTITILTLVAMTSYVGFSYRHLLKKKLGK